MRNELKEIQNKIKQITILDFKIMKYLMDKRLKDAESKGILKAEIKLINKTLDKLIRDLSPIDIDQWKYLIYQDKKRIEKTYTSKTDIKLEEEDIKLLELFDTL